MTYSVYEVEIATIPGHRLLQHIKASGPDEAQALVQEIQGPDAQLLGVEVWRECTEAEEAVMVEEQQAKEAQEAREAEIRAQAELNAQEQAEEGRP